MADRDYSPDEWSDHDFFLISQPGEQEALRQDLSWLPRTSGSRSRSARPSTA